MIPDNLSMIYFYNGKISHIYELEDGKGTGLYVSWYDNGLLEEESQIINGQRHGVSKRKFGENYWYLYFYNGDDITDKIAALVSDTNNITEQEKTIIALELGLLL